MDVSIVDTQGLSRTLRVELPAADIDKAVDARIRQYGGRAKIPGFRPGKAPFKVLQQRYGEAARAEVVEDQLRKTYPTALKQLDLKPAGYPAFEIKSEIAGQPLEYTATFEVYPEFELNDLGKLKIEAPTASIADADVDKTLESIRNQHKTWNAVERAAQDGDQIKIDFLGKLDGEPFDGGKGEEVEVELGAGKFIPSMEDGLKGLTAGTETVLDVQFPDDYQAENLAGKATTFDVKVHSVAEPQLPALDDAELLKALNVDEDAGEDGLRAKVRESLDAECEKAVKNASKQAVMDALLAANPIDVPGSLVDEEIPRLRQEAMQRFPNMPQDEDAAKQMLPDELFTDQARKRVALSLLVGEVVKSQDLDVSDDEVEATLAKAVGTPPDGADAEQMLNFYRGNPQIMQQIKAMAMEDKVVATLIDKATVKEKNLSFDELVNPQQGE